MKIYQAVQKLLVGGHTDRQTGDLISPLLFFESRLKDGICCNQYFSFSVLKKLILLSLA
jgi:hypothetical protein